MGNGTGSIINTLRTLLEREGESLLGNPLRLDAFLRDKHPDSPQQCFILIEILQTGLVDELRRAGFQHEHLHDEWAQILSAKSGISPKFGQECITLWAQALPSEFFVERTQGPLSNRPSETISLEDYLGPATQSAIEWANRFGAS